MDQNPRGPGKFGAILYRVPNGNDIGENRHHDNAENHQKRRQMSGQNRLYGKNRF
jgi:hypothetical protein